MDIIDIKSMAFVPSVNTTAVLLSNNQIYISSRGSHYVNLDSNQLRALTSNSVTVEDFKAAIKKHFKII